MYSPLIKNFFLYDAYQSFLHPKSSTLVVEFADLIKEIDKGHAVKPFKFKKAVNKELSQFYGFEQ